MTDKLVKHEPTAIQPRNMQELSEFARMASASGFFGDAREAAQAMVKIAAGAEMGIAPIQAMTSIHVIKGKISLSANLVAAMLKRAGYHYDVEWKGRDAVLINFYAPDKSFLGESSFSMDDAQQAGLLSNPTWKKFPRNMLFSRALMNGARWYAPDVALGLYDPDELAGSEPTSPPRLEEIKKASIVETIREKKAQPLEPEPEPERGDDWKKASRGIHAALRDVGIDREDFKKMISVSSMTELTTDQLQQNTSDLNVINYWLSEMSDQTTVNGLADVWRAALEARPRFFELIKIKKDECKDRLA